MGVAIQMRATGQRLAQLTMSDLCRGWRLEFAMHAGATVEYLAKAVVAEDNVRSLFVKPDELTDLELSILHRPGASQGSPARNQDDRRKARRLISTRKTITAKTALKLATEPLLRTGRDLNAAAARSTLDIRNRAIHLADLDPAEDYSTAQDALNAAESLWQGRPTELWGYFTLAADSIRQSDWDELHWNTVRRVALARDRHSLQGVVSNSERARLADDEPSTTCPVCRCSAHHDQRRGPGPADTTDWTDTATIDVLTCLSCGLELFGQIQIDHARSLSIY
jgi:hypothetical protein